MSQVIQGEVLSLDPTSLPSSGSEGEVRYDEASQTYRVWDINLLSWVQFPAGGGGGGGGGGVSVHWEPDAGEAPIEETENGLTVFLFEQTITQKLIAGFRVPEGTSGLIQMKNLAYSPSSTNEWRMQTITTLVRSGTDAVDSTTNQHISNSGDFTNTVANQLRDITTNLTDGLGEINGVPASPGDLLIVEISRQAPGGTEDSADVRLLPEATEVYIP